MKTAIECGSGLNAVYHPVAHEYITYLIAPFKYILLTLSVVLSQRVLLFVVTVHSECKLIHILMQIGIRNAHGSTLHTVFDSLTPKYK